MFYQLYGNSPNHVMGQNGHINLNVCHQNGKEHITGLLILVIMQLYSTYFFLSWFTIIVFHSKINCCIIPFIFIPLTLFLSGLVLQASCGF